MLIISSVFIYSFGSAERKVAELRTQMSDSAPDMVTQRPPLRQRRQRLRRLPLPSLQEAGGPWGPAPRHLRRLNRQRSLATMLRLSLDLLPVAS